SHVPRPVELQSDHASDVAQPHVAVGSRADGGERLEQRNGGGGRAWDLDDEKGHPQGPEGSGSYGARLAITAAAVRGAGAGASDAGGDSSGFASLRGGRGPAGGGGTALFGGVVRPRSGSGTGITGEVVDPGAGLTSSSSFT